MQKILIDICKKEKIEFNNEGVNALVSVSNGDMRTAINNLHAVYCNKKYINKKNIFLVCDVLDHSLVCSLIKDCLKQKNNDKLIASIEEMVINGYAVSDILQGLLDCIKYDNILKEEGVELSEKQKIIFMNEISRTKIIFSFGVDTIEQLYACFFRIINKLL